MISGITLQTSQTPYRLPVSLDKIKAGVAPVEGKLSEDPQDIMERRALDNRERRANINLVEQTNRDRRVNRKLRWRYASWVFCYLVSYSVAVFLILVCFGLGYMKIPEVVLSALVGSTAVSAIGLVGFVVSGLFKS